MSRKYTAPEIAGMLGLEKPHSREGLRRIGEAAAAFMFIVAMLAWAFVLSIYGGG